MKRKYLFSITILILLGLGSWYTFTPGHTPALQPPLVKLRGQNIAQFKAAFNQNPTETRLVLLLSPT